MKKKMIEWIKKYKFLISLFLFLSIIVGLLIGFQYIFILLFIILFLFFAKQGENEKPISPFELKKKIEELNKLETTAEILRKHVSEKDDYEAKLKLIEIEEQIKEYKQKNEL
jgi:cell shape-determining protein MreC